jgi:hypothetical protein
MPTIAVGASAVAVMVVAARAAVHDY